MILLNQPAPDWTLDPAWENAITNVSDLQGKWSVLLFFNVKCAGCTGRAIPFTRELLQHYPDIAIVGIHTDFDSTTSAERIDAVLNYFNLPYPVVRDAGKETFEAYEAEGTPHWIILDPEGHVHKSIFGSLGTALQSIEYTFAEVFQIA